VSYDGGTKLNVLEDVKLKTAEILLFSDGLANLGDFVSKRKIPVYAINSLVSANHQSLKSIATQSGGNYLNLLRVDFAKATQLLKMETYQFLGVIHDDTVREIYSRKRVNVFEDFSISGQFSKDTEIELLFGYGGRITQKIPVQLEASKGTKAVKRLWAKQKLAHLHRDKIANEKAITSLATKYSLITDYTSMIILDRIQDYARYKIKPPKELLEAYKEQLIVQKEAAKERQQHIQERRNDLQDSYEDLWDWYQAKITEEVQEETVKTVAATTAVANSNSQRRRTVRSQNLGPLTTITGSIIDEYGMPMPRVSVSVDQLDDGNSVLTDETGYYSIQANMGQELVFTYVGYNTEIIKITSQNINLRMESGEQLQEVVVVGYGGAVNSAKVASAVSTVSSSSVEQFLSPSDEIRKIREDIEMLIDASVSSSEHYKPLILINGTKSDVRSFRKIHKEDIYNLGILKNQEAVALYGDKARGGLVYVHTKKGMIENKAAIEAFEEKMASSIRLKAWNSNMPYIKELEKETSTANAYTKYLTLRERYVNIPTFYVDVADFFHSRQAMDTAITILTNLIEIELDNYELLKVLAYKLEYFKQYEMAVLAYEKVLELRPEEPQSYRDLALAYEHVGAIQKSYDLLHKIYNGTLVLKDEDGRFTGIENIAYIELTRLVNTYPKELKLKRRKRKVFKEMPVDVRIVIDWNHNDTDIDLWVFDPKGEKAFYNNDRTKIGGRISNDLTEGYGPEEFMLKNAVKGEYKIVVDHYANTMQKISGPTVLKVSLFTNYGTKHEKKKVTIVRLEEGHDELEVGSLLFE
jgi:tetratricopeptide (TPR) repeat protein